MNSEVEELQKFCNDHPRDINAWLSLIRLAERHALPELARDAWVYVWANQNVAFSAAEIIDIYINKIQYVHQWKLKLMRWLEIHYGVPKRVAFGVVTRREPLPATVKRLPFSDELNAMEGDASW